MALITAQKRVIHTHILMGCLVYQLIFVYSIVDQTDKLVDATVPAMKWKTVNPALNSFMNLQRASLSHFGILVYLALAKHHHLPLHGHVFRV
jgi:uncharacterized membrane protein